MTTYILDRQNGIYTSIGKSVIHLESLIGPFADVATAADYLLSMTRVTKGAPLPEGYSIISMYEPAEDWKEERAEEWDFKVIAAPRKDLKLRYAQKAKKRRKKRSG